METPGGWRSQEHGTLLRKAEESEQSQPKRDHMSCNQQGQRGGTTYALCGSHLTKPALGAGHVTIGFNVCSSGFWTCFKLGHFYLPVTSFWNGNGCLVLLYVGSILFSFLFLWGLMAKSLPWVSEQTLGLDFSAVLERLRLWCLLEMG